jgi:hypothetical protein
MLLASLKCPPSRPLWYVGRSGNVSLLLSLPDALRKGRSGHAACSGSTTYNTTLRYIGS